MIKYSYQWYWLGLASQSPPLPWLMTKLWWFCSDFYRLCLQRFSDYQMQEMSENFIDSFGFQDDEFTESEENVRWKYRTNIVCIFHAISSFGLNNSMFLTILTILIQSGLQTGLHSCILFIRPFIFALRCYRNAPKFEQSIKVLSLQIQGWENFFVCGCKNVAGKLRQKW